MNGAESLLRTAAASGIRICFANPGTTELPLVAAFDTDTGVRPILCLFEGVCSGAADGYARMSGNPAMTLLHLGPGFANGIANFHNARRARSAIFNVIGDHASWHLASDPPLASDIESLARPVSGWLRSADPAGPLSRDAAEAIAAARSGMVATLIAPHDAQLRDDVAVEAVDEPPPRSRPSSTAVEACARLLAQAGKGALLLGGDGLSERGLRAAARVSAATGCTLWCDTFPARLERGGDLPSVERVPYFPERAIEVFSGLSAVVFAGTGPPVSFFGYPGVPGRIIGERTETANLALPNEDVGFALEDLAEAVGRAEDRPAPAESSDRVNRPTGPLTPESLAAAVAGLQPEGAIVMDEGLTAARAYFSAAANAPPHTYLALTGGAIGQGLPCATGAALACPDRPVIALQADGSGMYTLQALWTQAREGLDVTTVILANRGYQILAVELARTGIVEPGPGCRSLTNFDPVPDWTQLARGFGVPAVAVEDAESLWRELDRALAEPGPHLIEVPI
jgi:acetolactate synthase-1/2/3 large subunit